MAERLKKGQSGQAESTIVLRSQTKAGKSRIMVMKKRKPVVQPVAIKDTDGRYRIICPLESKS